MNEKVYLLQSYNIKFLKKIYLQLEERMELKIIVVRDYAFVESLEPGNKYLHNQDNEHFDELEHEDYFLKRDNNNTSGRNRETQTTKCY